MATAATVVTLSSLSEVLGFDIIEYWTPNDSNELRCTHYYHADSVKQVVKKIYSDPLTFTPNSLSSWSENSIRVIFFFHYYYYRGDYFLSCANRPDKASLIICGHLAITAT